MRQISLPEERAGWPHASPVKDREGAPQGALPRVSLVTPSYNQDRFLEDTILSVLNQDYPNLEYMVFDGGSTDGSREIIEKYAARLAYWESEPDRGQSHAINKGWARSTGDYVWWLNADDMLSPASLRTSVALLEDHPEVDMVYGDVIRVDATGRMIDLYPYQDFAFPAFVLRGLSVAQAGALMRRRVIDRIGFLDESLHYLMDHDYWTRLALAGGRIVHIPLPLALFRIHDSAKTQRSSIRVVEEARHLHRNLMAHTDLPPEIRKGRGRIASNMHLYSARALVKVGRYREALGEIRGALFAWPPQVLGESLWRHLALSVLGLAVGEKAWMRIRAWVRRLRRLTSDGARLG